jgi:hypothetical protein
MQNGATVYIAARKESQLKEVCTMQDKRGFMAIDDPASRLSKTSTNWAAGRHTILWPTLECVSCRLNFLRS